VRPAALISCCSKASCWRIMLLGLLQAASICRHANKATPKTECSQPSVNQLGDYRS
jgi:hypothetical protein